MNTQITFEQYREAKQICEMYEKNIKSIGDLKDIRDCNLPIRLMHALLTKDLCTIGEVREYRDKNGIDSFYKFRGVGRKYVDDIKILLQ
jgi:DNA-directed RNA polymerase alpha subunit